MTSAAAQNLLSMSGGHCYYFEEDIFAAVWNFESVKTCQDVKNEGSNCRDVTGAACLMFAVLDTLY